MAEIDEELRICWYASLGRGRSLALLRVCSYVASRLASHHFRPTRKLERAPFSYFYQGLSPSFLTDSLSSSPPVTVSDVRQKTGNHCAALRNYPCIKLSLPIKDCKDQTTVPIWRPTWVWASAGTRSTRATRATRSSSSTTTGGTALRGSLNDLGLKRSRVSNKHTRAHTYRGIIGPKQGYFTNKYFKIWGHMKALHLLFHWRYGC